MTDRKTEALIACAKAYLARGEAVQYDQLSMDRLLRITPRRRIFLPPEAGTSQQPLYLDCSGFIHAAFWNTFGYELPAKLTWHMIEQVKPRLFYRELTHEESEEELKTMREELRAMLRPGDIVTYEYAAGNGHTMLIVSDTEFMHCSGNGHPGSYLYPEKRDQIIPGGAIRCDPIEAYFAPRDESERFYLFSKKIKRFAVCRPLAAVGEPTPEALARLENGEDLSFSVLSSHPGGRTVCPGERIVYRVQGKNSGRTAKTVRIRFEGPEGSRLEDAAERVMGLPAGGSAELSFTLLAEDAKDGLPQAPRVLAGRQPIWAPPFLTRNASRRAGGKAFAERRFAQIEAGGPVWPEAAEDIRRYFFPFDAAHEDVLFRRPQQPLREAAVYGMFGGIGVITPGMGPGNGMRCTRISRQDLECGDILLCSDDSYGEKAYACLVTDDALTGQFEAGGPVETRRGGEADRFLDSLFGRFAFILLRPAAE